MRGDAVRAIDKAGRSGAVVIPAIVPWEIAVVARKGRLTPVDGVEAWLRRALAIEGARTEPMSAAMAYDAATLPGSFHADPADRFFIATARALGAPVVTRDRSIIAYGRAGHVHVLPC